MESKFQLIDGVFSVQEAREVIEHLLEFKIQYHTKQNFSSEIRKGVKDDRALARKERLIATKEAFLKHLENFSAEDEITISSEIYLKKNGAV